MGIVNVTPDSFSDGAQGAHGPQAALAKARHLVECGADILDLGGQSTRPGASHLTAEEEASRVVPAIRCALSSCPPRLRLWRQKGHVFYAHQACLI